MNEIIKNIEAAQLKAEVADFHVGDTVKVYARNVPTKPRFRSVPDVTVLNSHFLTKLLIKCRLLN